MHVIAPYLETDDLRYIEFTDQNHLMQPSPYRGKPTREVEDAWLKLWRRMIPRPSTIMQLRNANDDMLVLQFPPFIYPKTSW